MHTSTNRRRGTFRWHLWADLPDNPLCWLFGHSARVEVVEYPGKAYLQAWLLIECRRCGRRYNNPHGLSEPIGSTCEERAARQQRAVELVASRLEVARRDPVMVAASASGRDHYSRSQLELGLETSRQKWRWFSAGLHVGTRHSESPWHAHLYVPGWAVHLSAGGVLQRYASWLGRGHKRDLEVSLDRRDGRFGVGELRWKLWYDNDGGNDSYHDCDKWRPMPWERRRLRAKAAAGDDWGRHPESRGAHYRSWACIREGTLPLNLATLLWGSPKFHREEFLPVHEAVVNVGEFPGDHYLVTFQLERSELRRDRGPAWARRVLHIGWHADWRANPGLPVRNHEWKGDEILGSAEPLTEESVDEETWLADAVRSLVARVKKDRVHHGYRPPRDRFAL